MDWGKGRGRDWGEGVIPVFGVGFTAPAVAAGVAAAAVVVGVASVVVFVGAAAVDEDAGSPDCAFCFLALRRAQRALRPFLTCAAASGAAGGDGG